MYILKKYAPWINFFQRILDVLLLLLITWALGKRFEHPDLMRLLAIYGSLVTVVVFFFFRIYKSWRGFSISSHIKTLFIAWLSVLAVLNITIPFITDENQLVVLWPVTLFRRPEFLLWSLMIFVAFAALRVAVKLLLKLSRGKGYNQRSAVIVGAGEEGKKIAHYLYDNRWMGIKIKGFFDDGLAEGEIVTGSPAVFGPVLGSVEKSSGFTISKGIDMAFIALPMQAAEKIDKLVFELGTNGVNVFLVPALSVFGFQKARSIKFGEFNLINFNLFPAWKRAFDILFSLTAIIVTLPLWLLIMLLIKMEDGGPVFYRHKRITERGKRFNCIKFRTMLSSADQKLKEMLQQNQTFREEWKRTYKLRNDPRVTKFGRFLRKTSLDELPQFINVLSGNMSVVGARPIVSEELEKYYKKEALTYCAMKPGITGPWQVGIRSDTDNYDVRVAMDCWYVLNCSIWLDVKIIFKTIWRVLKPKGAY